MQAVQVINLGGIAPILNGDDKRCIYLIDPSQNSYTFFKYKGRLIDVHSLWIQVQTGKKTKEEAFQQIRKGLVYGIHKGQAVIFHISDNQTTNWNQFLKEAKFWNPQQLFRSPKNMSQKWYRQNLMKPTDKDNFGNEGSLFPSDQFIIFVSVHKSIPFESFDWLKESKKEFRIVQIE